MEHRTMGPRSIAAEESEKNSLLNGRAAFVF